MDEIAPGIWHWTAHRESIGADVQSYWIEPAGLVLDPMIPPDVGLEWWDDRDRKPEQIVLTIGLHWRETTAFVDRFGARVRAHEAALPRWKDAGDDDRDAEPFTGGDEIAPGVEAVDVGAIAPDEAALFISHGEGTVAAADSIVRWEPGDPLGFVPDNLMGDDPEEVKRGIRESFGKLLERDWKHLIMAHGAPGTKDELAKFLSG
jgi:hypothetical protein